RKRTGLSGKRRLRRGLFVPLALRGWRGDAPRASSRSRSRRLRLDGARRRPRPRRVHSETDPNRSEGAPGEGRGRLPHHANRSRHRGRRAEDRREDLRGAGRGRQERVPGLGRPGGRADLAERQAGRVADHVEGNATIFARIDAGDAAAVAALVEADPSAANARNESGDSPVLVALYGGRADIAETLLARGAELDLFGACGFGLAGPVPEVLGRHPSPVVAYQQDGRPALPRPSL